MPAGREPLAARFHPRPVHSLAPGAYLYLLDGDN